MRGSATVGVRLRALGMVALLVMMIGALPGLTPSAGAADPIVVTVATHNLEPFVMTRDGIKSGFTIELLQAVAERENVTLEYVDVANVTEQLQAVAEGRVDAAATAVAMAGPSTSPGAFRFFEVESRRRSTQTRSRASRDSRRRGSKTARTAGAASPTASTSSRRRSASAIAVMTAGPTTDPVIDPMPPTTSMVITRKVRSK